VRDGVRLADADGTRISWLTPDAPLVTLGDINRGEWLAKPRPASGLVFSYAMNNYWWTNYKAGQGGGLTFRYEIGTGAADQDRFAQESFTPLLAAGSPGVRGGEPARIAVSGKGVALTTLKGAQDGRGRILRIRNTTDAATTARVGLPAGPWRAERCTLVERRTGDLPVSAGTVAVPLGPRETATVRLLAPTGRLAAAD